jgi:hypothetical protein
MICLQSIKMICHQSKKAVILSERSESKDLLFAHCATVQQPGCPTFRLRNAQETEARRSDQREQSSHQVRASAECP